MKPTAHPSTAWRLGHARLIPARGQRAAMLTFLAMFLIAAGAMRAAEQRRLKTESFDRDPGWEGVNNRVKVEKPIPVVQDFGYSPTQHAGGKAPGEIGGRVQRSTTPAFYAQRLAKALTLDSRLHCSGSFAVNSLPLPIGLCSESRHGAAHVAAVAHPQALARCGGSRGCSVEGGGEKWESGV